MTIKPSVNVSDGKLTVKNRTVLTGVPAEVISSSSSDSGPVAGAFLSVSFDDARSRHVISLGRLRSLRFVACFRFKLWWMAQRMGDRGGQIPLETQFLLVETDGGGSCPVYAVFLPLIEGSFRACLQGNAVDDGLELCIESGDANVRSSSFDRCVYIHCGEDPFATIGEAIRAVKFHLKTFRRREEKILPGIVDFFGWCTWDAFYQDVSMDGVEAGIRSLAEGGAPAKFVIIDDGWQSVEDEEDEQTFVGLTGVKENSKFRSEEDSGAGIKSIVDVAKNELGVKYVYVWHAIIGYWGGVRPGGEYRAEKRYAVVSDTVLANDPGWKADKLVVGGVGLVDPRTVGKFYNELHGYLGAAGVDGVKVDVQCVLETLGEGLGGRVELIKQYHQALDASVARNFLDNGCIACMSHNTDALYCSKQTAIVRASDDFYPRDPMSHTIHIASVAYNSVFLGEFMLPDWDMFHSLHPAAEYHASARAISGGPIYVSDAPGNHDFELLKKLVLPDGSVLRPCLPGRPTQDCLFSDPARDGISLLKIWNMNKYTGVLGVYNCQGAAWSSTERKNVFHQTPSGPITGYIRGCDIHCITDAATEPEWNGDCAAYCFRSGNLIILPHKAAVPVSLNILEHDIYTVTPIKVLAPGFEFAPMGLINMYNSGGAIRGLRYETKNAVPSAGLEGRVEEEVENRGSEFVGIIHLEVIGCGKFGAYSSAKPRQCVVNSHVVDFTYDPSSGLVTINLDNMPEEGSVHDVGIEL